MKLIVKLTADELMNVVDSAKEEADKHGFLYNLFAEEQTGEVLKVVDAALDAAGIEIIEEDDILDEDIDFDDDEIEWDDVPDEPIEKSYKDKYPGIASMVYVSHGKRVISKSNALDVMRSIIKSVDEFAPDASIDKKRALQKDMFTRFAQDFGFEGVDMSE